MYGVDFMYNSQETALRIKNVAKQRGKSIGTLQQECGLGKNAINQLADSQEGMKSKNLYAIAEYLNVSIDYLLGRTPEQSGYSNNQIQTGDIVGDHNANMNINSEKTKPTENVSNYDETTKQVAEMFSKMDIIDKSKVLSLMVELSQKKVS